LAITEHLAAIEQGRGHDDDLASLNALLRTVTDANRCYLGTEEQQVVSSLLRAFPEDFAGHLERRTRRPRPVLVPLIVDITPDGTVVYATRHTHKRPDWTYAD
jgi:hypothetical protein